MVSRVPSRQRNAPVQRETDHRMLKRLALLLFCGLVLAGGFVYAGVQHFGALRLGYETEKLRLIRDNLEEEQRRLLSTRETAASPGRLERAARQLGLQPLQAAQIAILSFNETASPGDVSSTNSALTAGSSASAKRDHAAIKRDSRSQAREVRRQPK